MYLFEDFFSPSEASDDLRKMQNTLIQNTKLYKLRHIINHTQNKTQKIKVKLGKPKKLFYVHDQFENIARFSESASIICVFSFLFC